MAGIQLYRVGAVDPANNDRDDKIAGDAIEADNYNV